MSDYSNYLNVEFNGKSDEIETLAYAIRSHLEENENYPGEITGAIKFGSTAIDEYFT